MLNKFINILSISVIIVLFASGVSLSADTVPSSPAPVQDAGHAKTSVNPRFDESAQPMSFSDAPKDAALDKSDDADKSPDNISSGELLKAIDSTSTTPADETVADSGRHEAAPSDTDILDPLSVVNDDYRSHVERNVSMFSKTLKERFKVWLGRSGKYIEMMKAVFREKNLPEDLVYLSLIESGFNPKAYSWASASGPWQFISGTGKKYGLKINSWVDERRDPEKSTRAAAAYLQDLYNMFGTWSLAMAAYNSGEGNVSRAIQQNGTLDFWELRKTRSLATETKEYVPRYLAARAIALSPQSYGLDGIEYEEPLSYDVVKLDKPVDLEVAAKICNTSVDVIRELNPELKRWCTPPNTPGYALRVPKGTAALFAANRDSIPASDTANWKDYTARRGDTLYRVARRYGVSLTRLADINGMKRRSRLRTGQHILIPRSGVVTASNHTADDKAAAGHARTYRVRRGDTLSSVARRHGLSTARLASLNGLRNRSMLRTGQILKLAASSQADGMSATPAMYRVKKGDTLSEIADRHGVSSDALADMNGITKHSVLKVGQRIRVGGGSQASGNTYKVSPGDSLWSISRQFGVSVEALMNANSLTSGSLIKPGLELVIPAKGGMDT